MKLWNNLVIWRPRKKCLAGVQEGQHLLFFFVLCFLEGLTIELCSGFCDGMVSFREHSPPQSFMSEWRVGEKALPALLFLLLSQVSDLPQASR